MKYRIPFLLILSFLLSACGALGTTTAAEDATAPISAEDIRATADVMVYEMLTQTQAAMPTNTLIPPTNTPLPLPSATFVIEPTAISTIEGIASPTSISTATQSSSSITCDKQPLGKWTGDSVSLSVTNNVKDTTATVFLCITTPYNESGYISAPVGTTSVPLGCYHATAWVSGEKDFNATTTFCLKNTANVQLIIENNSLILKAGCAPNC